jgi:lysylphosphatidylglycerol synthetase-like protein (DUF2156 family)
VGSNPVGWVLSNVGPWTWFVAQNRVWVIVAVSAVGFLGAFLGAFRKYRPGPTPSIVLRSTAMGLAFSSAAVTVSSLLHFSDLRWLPPAQRTHTHLNPPGGLFGFAKPIVGAVNQVASVPVEFRAVEQSVHVAFVCALIALLALVVVALTSRRARRADIRLIVREEIRKSAAAPEPELSRR